MKVKAVVLVSWVLLFLPSCATTRPPVTSNSDVSSAQSPGPTTAQAYNITDDMSEAVSNDDIARFSSLIEKGADINAQLSSGRTAVEIAANNDYPNFVQFLMGKGADIEKSDDNGDTPLIIASRAGHDEIVSFLVDHGARLEAKNKLGSTALMESGTTETTELLLNGGAKIEARDNDGAPALIHSVTTGTYAVAAALIRHGAQVNVENNIGQTPLSVAAQIERLDMVDLLLKNGAAIDGKDTSMNLLMPLAAQAGRKDIVSALLTSGADARAKNKNGESALYLALKGKYLDVAESLMQAGASADETDSNGLSLLLSAARNGNGDIVELLAKYGATIDAKDMDGATALYLALQNKNIDIAEFLLHHGARVDATANDGEPLLVLAMRNNKWGVAEFLLKHGAAVDAKDAGGKTALYWAVQNGNPYTAVAILGYSADSSGIIASGTPLWAQTTTSKTSSIMREPSGFSGVATDGVGNVYAVGYISAHASYSFADNVTVTGVGQNSNAVLVKYDRSGTALWARTVTTQSSDDGYSFFRSVAIDANGNIYVTGVIDNGTYSFGPGVTVQGSDSDYMNVSRNVLLVKYDSSGRALWAHSSTGPAATEFKSVAVDAVGNAYAVGYMDGIHVPSDTKIFNFGNGVTATAGRGLTNIALVKYSASGKTLWIRTVVSGSADTQFDSVALDAGGAIYAAGYITGKSRCTFAPGVVVTGGYGYSWNGYDQGTNVLLVKYAASGAAQWARTIVSGAAESKFNSVAVDGTGNVYAAGFVNGTGTFIFSPGISTAGSYSHASGSGDSGSNVVLVKYDSSGVAQWARSIAAGASSTCFSSIAVDSNGAVNAAGYMNGTGTITFDSGVTAVGACDANSALLVRYDPSGGAQWARSTVSGTDSSAFDSVSVDASGNMYAAGSLKGTGIFDMGMTDSPKLYVFGKNVQLAMLSDDSPALVKYSK